MVKIRNEEDLLRHMKLHDSDISSYDIPYVIAPDDTFEIMNTNEESTGEDTLFFDVKYCYYCGKKFTR